MVSRLFEKAPRYFEKLSRYYEKVPRYYEMASRLFEKVPRYFEKVSRYYEMVSRLFEKVPRYFEKLSRYYEMVFRLFEKVPRYFEKVSRYYEKLPRYYEMASRLFEKVPRYFEKFSRYYAANFEEVDGTYWFRVVRASVRSRTMHSRVLKFHIWIPHGKIFDTLFFFFFFFCPSYLPFWSYAPLKNSERNLMHAISYEPCMLGFRNFIYGFIMEIWLTHIFFLVRVISLSGDMPL